MHVSKTGKSTKIAHSRKKAGIKQKTWVVFLVSDTLCYSRAMGWAWQHTPVAPATQEVEVDGLWSEPAQAKAWDFI